VRDARAGGVQQRKQESTRRTGSMLDDQLNDSIQRAAKTDISVIQQARGQSALAVNADCASRF
jgi:hypothetical protein